MDNTLTKSDETLDDIMLAMDVVDTLRHEQFMLEKDLAGEARREDLIIRLRGIYKAQGIEVPNSVLMDGVLALEEERFRFTPAKPGFGTRLANLYINRRKWMPLIYTLSFIFGAVWLVNYVGFVRPQQVEAKQIETQLTNTLPEALSEAREKAVGLATTDALKARADALYQNGVTALGDRNVKGAEKAISNLDNLSRALGQSYQLRIVSRFNEASGIYLDSKVNPDIRNFYLIVEAVDASGSVLSVDIEDEEYKTVERVTKFGVRVPKSVFDAVAADKRDDQIIQDDILGQKPRGVLEPTLKFDAPTGYIVDW